MRNNRNNNRVMSSYYIAHYIRVQYTTVVQHSQERRNLRYEDERENRFYVYDTTMWIVSVRTLTYVVQQALTECKAFLNARSSSTFSVYKTTNLHGIQELRVY